MNCKTQWNRFTAAALCASLLLCGLVSCKDDAADSEAGQQGSAAAELQTLTPEEYEAYSFANVKSAFPDIPYVYAFDHGDGTADDTVTYDEYRYYQLLYKNYFDGGDNWGGSPQ